MADVGVFGRYKGFSDFQEAAKVNNLKEALASAQIQAAQAKMAKTAAGGDLPAALQLANEYQKRLDSGDIQGANTIAAFAKTVDKGLQVGTDGNYYVARGYAPALGEIAGTKAGAAEQAKKDVQAVMNPIIKGGEAAATANVDIQTKPIIQEGILRAELGVKKESDVNKAETATRTNIKAFSDLLASSKEAPSGALSTIGAQISSKGQGESKSAKALGDFTVRKANAENAIRSTFRVAGSGAQSDRDAKPFIEMLPSEYDSAPVKEAKIKAAMDSMMAKAREVAAANGKPDPFPQTAVDVFGSQAPDTNFRETLNKPVTPKDMREKFNSRKAAKKPRLKYNPATGDFE